MAKNNEILELRPKEAKEVMRHGLRHGFNQLWCGAPGVGKTEIIQQAAAEEGYDVLISHPVTADPTDYKGLPVRLELKDGRIVAAFLPFGDLRQIIEATRPLLFFIDDLIQAPPAVQAAGMQLLQARKINDHKVADCVRMMAATNRKEDKAGGTTVLNPVKSRFFIMHLGCNQEDWALWAMKNGIDPVCISFTNYRPEFISNVEVSPDLQNLPCPRNMTEMFRCWMTHDYPKAAEHAYLAGRGGSVATSEFLAFARVWEHLPDVNKCLKDPDSFQVPTKPDILYALSGALAAKADKKNAANFFKACSRLGKDFSVLAVRDALRRDKSLLDVDQFTDWLVAHQDVIL